VPLWNQGKQRATSRLKRILSIPRYHGASRKRIKCGKNGDTSWNGSFALGGHELTELKQWISVGCA
jgi:hypothetical protein